MNSFSFYDPQSGVLTGQTYTGHSVETNTPSGLHAVEGFHDHTKRRIDVASGLLIDWTPPPPDGAALASRVRADRDRRLAACDWLATRAAEDGSPMPTEWRAYRAALRGITAQAGFPVEVEWPKPPGAIEIGVTS